MKKNIFFLIILFCFIFCVPASAEYAALDCNNAGAQYFTCQNRIDKTCNNYPKSVLQAPGPVTPKSYCETANMDFLSCSGGMGSDPACAITSASKPLGCCILSPMAVGAKSTCVDITNQAQAAACINKDINAFQVLVSGVNFNWKPGQECASFTECAVAPSSVEGGAQTSNQLQDLLIKSPGISIGIPGLDFSTINKPDEEGYLYIPWLAEYMTALYKFLIGIVSIVAAVMIIVQGVRVVTSGGGAAKMDAYKKIFRAVIGLVIAWGSYAILYTVNPSLVQFNALKVQYINRAEIVEEGEKNMDPLQVSASESGGAAGVGATISEIIGGYSGAPCSLEGAQAAAKALYNAVICVGPCHCSWTAVRFLDYIGCGNLQASRPSSAFPVGAAVKAEQLGWKTIEITPDNSQNLPLGLLITKGGGHAGVSIGNGQAFESGGGSPNFKLQSCIKPWPEVVANPSLCQACAKVKGHEPFAQVFGAGTDASPKRPYYAGTGSGCNTTQGWVITKIRKNTGWGYVIVPPSNLPSGSAKEERTSCSVKCCGGTWSVETSKTLCNSPAVK